MKRRIIAQAQDTNTTQALLDYKQATLDVILSKISDTATFGQLGGLVGRSDEWARLRLIQHPERLYRVGKRYLVPRGVAEAFIRSVLV